MNTNSGALVTGSNRSGSTWVGKVLAMNPKVDTIIEPFNLNRIKRFNRISYDYWYPKIEGKQSKDYKIFQDLIKYYLEANYSTFVTQIFESYEGHSRIKSIRKKWRRATKPYKVLKDPTAIFSAEWIAREFQLQPVVLIRHPAAYALSIKEKNWWFDFDNFLKQSDFFNGPLADLKEEVEYFKLNEKNQDIIDNAALLWKVFYTQVNSYRQQFPGWFYITHEALSINPLKEFEKMFDYLELKLTNRVQNYIISSSQAAIAQKHQRDSKKNAIRWKNNLSTFEKDRIFSVTKSVSNLFYEPF